MWPLLTKTAVPDCDEMVHSHLEFSCCQLRYFENGFQNDSRQLQTVSAAMDRLRAVGTWPRVLGPRHSACNV